MEYLKQLSKDEHDEYNRQTNIFHADDKTRESCLRYFLQYKASVTHIPIDKLGTIFRCAFFVAEKSQAIYNLKGEKVRGIGLSLSQLLRNSQLDDFIIVLKDFLKRVKITDPEAENDLNVAFRRISFLITFHLKFEKTLQKLELKERVSESFGYSKILSSFAWLLFIDSKNRMLKGSLELIENTCLLAHVIAFMLIYSWDYVRPAGCTERKTTDCREISLFVQEKVLEMFLIKNVDTYKLIANSFEEYFEELVGANVIKMTHGKIDFLSPDHINANYKKLDYQYQKTLTPEDIDERIFFKDRAANLTPSKFTPFIRQGHVNKLASKPSKPNGLGNYESNKQNFSSHRILTYEMNYEKSESQTPKGGVSNVNDIKFPKGVINSPSLTKPTLICSTPITTGMEMYNYLSDKSQKAKESGYPVRKLDGLMGQLIDRVLDSRDTKADKTREIKYNLIFSLYKIVSEEYSQQNPHERDNQSMIRAILALSAELVFFVSNITVFFDEIESVLETHRLHQWIACDFFLKFDRSMPSALKLHLLDLEVNMVSFKIWQDPQLTHMMHSLASGNPTPDSVERCFKRLLHQVAFQITQLSNALKINERISESVFDTVKFILCHHTDQLLYRHVDQMILCAIFATCKVHQIDIRFNEIREKYQQVNPNNKSLHEQIICKCYVSHDKRVDIIKFYNAVFIGMGNLKTFLINVKKGATLPMKGASFLQSPLRAIIPKELSFNKLQQKKNPKTPHTNLLYAYTQSPMLKCQLNSLKTTALHSRKVINFDEEEKLLKKRCTEIAEMDDELPQPNDFMTKKCTLPSNILRNPPMAGKAHYDRK